MNDLPSWATHMLRKRPEVALLVFAMISHGIRNGKVTAEDAHHIPVTHPNARGVSVKYLARCGFEKGQIITGSTKQSKGHYLCEWILSDYRLAKSIIDGMSGIIARIEYGSKEQLPLI